MKQSIIKWASLAISKGLPTLNKLGVSLMPRILKLSQLLVISSRKRVCFMIIKVQKKVMTSVKYSQVNTWNLHNRIIGSQ